MTWGVALRDNSIFVNTDANLVGVVSTRGGQIVGHGALPSFGTLAQDEKGNIFVMNPSGRLWEIKKGTLRPIPFGFKHPIPTSFGDYGLAYSQGHLYVLHGDDLPTVIYQVSF